MEWSSWLTLAILVVFTVFLVIVGIKAYRDSAHAPKSREQNALNSLLFDMFTSNNCAENPEGNSGNHIKYVEPYLKDKINLEFITRKCSSDD